MNEGMVEASSGRTCETADPQAQKGTGLRPCSTQVHGDPSNKTRRKVPSEGHEIMNTRNGETRHGALGAGDQAVCYDGVGCPKKQKPVSVAA